MEHKERIAIPITWQEGDAVTIRGQGGIVGYVYTNGYTLVTLSGKTISGGIFNNDSTYGNELINS